MLVAIDAGKYGTKGLVKKDGKLQRSYFRTKVDEVKTNQTVTGKTFMVDFKGKKFVIGDDALSEDLDISKQKLIHKLSILTTVSNSIERSCEVQLIIGTPLSNFMNIESREQYRQFMMKDKYIEIVVNHHRKRFQIIDVKVAPESLGAVYRKPSYYKDRLVAVIDIGGLNTNGAIYENLKPIKTTYFTINQGGTILMNEIKRQLNTQLGLNYQDYEIEHLLKNGLSVDGINLSNGRTIINDIMQAHLNNIIQETKKFNWNLRALEVVFIGGGSTLLNSVISQAIPHATISPDSVWDNVNAFHEVGELYYGRKN